MVHISEYCTVKNCYQRDVRKWGVACNLEYENLENGYLEFVLISKNPATGILKKNYGNLEINHENGYLKKAVGNLVWTPTIPVMNTNFMIC